MIPDHFHPPLREPVTAPARPLTSDLTATEDRVAQGYIASLGATVLKARVSGGEYVLTVRFDGFATPQEVRDRSLIGALAQLDRLRTDILTPRQEAA